MAAMAVSSVQRGVQRTWRSDLDADVSRWRPADVARWLRGIEAVFLFHVALDAAGRREAPRGCGLAMTSLC